MHSIRQVLRPTHNRLPLTDVSSDKFSNNGTSNKTNLLTTNTSLQQQENRIPLSITNKIPSTTRPILTAIRSIKSNANENVIYPHHVHDDETSMLISPIVKTARIIEQKLSIVDVHKTHEELEEDLFEL
jgi:hypothetical protein